MSLARSVLVQPCVQFLLAGAALFGLHRAVAGEPSGEVQSDAEARDVIVVSAGRVDSLVRQFAKVRGRSPSEAERRGLIDAWVDEEVMVREGLALGLDVGDSVIRRRIQQKLEFVLEDTAALAEPSDAQLQDMLDASPEVFLIAPAAAVTQIYFDLERRGDAAERALVEVRGRLTRAPAAARAAEPASLGDPSRLPTHVALADLDWIEQGWGSDYALAVASAPLGQWAGPVRSAYGLHLIRVDARTPARVPALAEVREAVAREWTARERVRLREASRARLRAGYRVVVQDRVRDGGRT